MPEQAQEPQQEQDGEVEESAEESPQSGKFPKVVVIVGALLGVGLGAMTLGPVAAPLLAGFGGGGGGQDEGGGGGGHGEEASAPVTIHVVENMVVNPAGSQGRRMLLASIAIDVGNDTGMIQDIVDHELDLRSRFIYVFGRRTMSELSDMGLRETITRELQAVTEEVLGNKVQRVFLPQFVLQ